MSVQGWTFTLVALSFALYIGVAVWSRANTTRDFYVAGKGVPPLANGMATAADWMSAASFISMAGLIAFLGYDGSVYLMGWTGGYVLLALLLAPYLRKFGRYTVPDFVGDRYYSKTARVVAVVCAIFVSFTYVAGQMRGVGIVFSRFLEVPIELRRGHRHGDRLLLRRAGRDEGYHLHPGGPILRAHLRLHGAGDLPLDPHHRQSRAAAGVGQAATWSAASICWDRLDGLHEQLGFAAYTDGSKSMLDVFAITAALMVGTAGLPHVIIRFYTVPRVRDARLSAGWALLFIAILYTTAPAVAVFARTNLLNTVSEQPYETVPEWFTTWEDTDLIAYEDHNGDGLIQFVGPDAVDASGQPVPNELTIDQRHHGAGQPRRSPDCRPGSSGWWRRAGSRQRSRRRRDCCWWSPRPSATIC